MLAGDGVTLLDDMTPEMCQISYTIGVSISRRPLVEGGPAKTLVAVAKKVRIIPAADEQPPLDISDDCQDYCTRKEKDVKKGLLRGKLGRLVMAASQPKPLQLRPTTKKSESTDPVSTVATLHLRFDPIRDEQPPKLGTLWSKLKVSTFYTTNPWTDFPARTPALTWSTDSGVYTETVPLASRCIASAQWEKHTAGDDFARRDSMQSMSSAESITGPSASYSGKTYYTASLLVPITLPKEKAFVPTFHCCLVSRVYALELCISYHTPHANILAPTCSLKIPIQITSERNADARTNQLADNPMITHPTDVDDEFFRPRSIAPPDPEYLGRAALRGVNRNLSDRPSSVLSSPSTMSLSDMAEAYPLEPLEPPEYSDLAPLSGRPRDGEPSCPAPPSTIVTATTALIITH